MDQGAGAADAWHMDAQREVLSGDRASAPDCSVPGCGNVSILRRVTAEPLEWELGELEPFVAVAFLCEDHLGGVDAPDHA